MLDAKLGSVVQRLYWIIINASKAKTGYTIDMDGQKRKGKQSLITHLGFLKRIGDVATGTRSDNESILEKI